LSNEKIPSKFSTILTSMGISSSPKSRNKHSLYRYHMNICVNSLLKLDYVYKTADTEKKWGIISSMFPEKMTFDGFAVRTNRINEIAKLKYIRVEYFIKN
jgi:hypothetical protein